MKMSAQDHQQAVRREEAGRRKQKEGKKKRARHLCQRRSSHERGEAKRQGKGGMGTKRRKVKHTARAKTKVEEEDEEETEEEEEGGGGGGGGKASSAGGRPHRERDGRLKQPRNEDNTERREKKSKRGTEKKQGMEKSSPKGH